MRLIRLFFGLLLLIAPEAQGQLTYATNGGTITVTGYKRGVAILSPLIIPNSIDGLPVTSIGDYALINLGVSSVVIPDSVTSIGEYAFTNSHILSVTLGNGLTSIGNFAFAFTALHSITFGNSLASIGEYAFGDDYLTNIDIPASVISLGAFPFGYNQFATAINVDSNNPAYVSVNGVLMNKSQTTLIEYSSSSSFYSSYTIPDTVTTIGTNAFAGAYNLTNVTIGNSVTNIADYAFFNCGKLWTSVTIGDNVTNVGQYAFGWDYYGSGAITNLTIGSNVTSIGSNAFRGQLLNHVTFLCSVPENFRPAFYESPQSITVSGIATNIGDYAFKNFGSLRSAIVGKTVTSIGTGAFQNCALTSVCFEGNAPSDGGSIFTEDERLSSIYYVSEATGWGTNFSGVPAAPCTQCGGPTITGQPASTIVLEGSNAVFTVAVSGSGQLGYQWQFLATNMFAQPETVNGATNSTLTISDVQATNVGSYSVIVSDETGSVTSDSATLAIAGMANLIPSSEYSALTDLFNTTAGPGWNNNNGWSNGMAATWFGVQVTNVKFDENGNLIPNSGNVSEISLTANNLAGALPATLDNFSGLTVLDLSSNRLQGRIPSIPFLSHLQVLDLSSNSLTGAIPAGFGDMTATLATLNLSANQLTGSIPFDLHSMARLQTLDLSRNKLNNPVNLGIMNRLLTLDLSRNSFSGSLTNIGVFPNLECMDLSDNEISGTIPVSSGFFLSLSESTLQRLDLSSNRLTGPIRELGLFVKLDYLALSSNQLSGGIPADLNSLSLLQTLDLSRNKLSNAIPDLSGLGQLKTLNLSGNGFSGSMPGSLLSLHELQNVDLSGNHLAGNVVDISPLNFSGTTVQTCKIQRNDLDFISISLPEGPANIGVVSNMIAYGIDATWLPQNGPSTIADPRIESAPNGEPASLSVAAQGAPPMYYQWQLNGTNLTDDSRVTGSQTTNLSISPVSFTDEGSYEVVITNAYGSITSAPAMLTVTGSGIPPEVTNQSVTQSISMGGSALFVASATGSTPFFYQWSVNGTNVLGATTTALIITNASLTDAGAYTVVVSNSFGVATNFAGTLSVVSVPLTFAPDGDGIQFADGIVTLQISGLTGTGSAVVDVSSDLINWTPISTNSTDSGTIQIFDTISTNASQLYYRIVVSP